MQPPKPPKPSVPPPLARPASIPPPAPIPPPAQPGSSSVPPPNPIGASAPPARVPPASPPPAIAPPSSVPPAPRPAVPAPSSAPPAQAAAAEPEFYIKEGDDVRKLGAEQIRLEVASGGLASTTLICKVGDTEWHSIADAAAVGLPLGDLDSVTSNRVSDAELVFEQFPAGDSFFDKLKARLSRVENKGRLAVWGVATAVALLWVMQRAGSLYAVADFVGQSDAYEDLESSLIGGPGSGTVRRAEQLWAELVPQAKVPFSKIAESTKLEGAKKAEASPDPADAAPPDAGE